MIKILKDNKLFIIAPIDVVGLDDLDSPIHKLYFKNYLHASYEQDSKQWKFTEEAESSQDSLNKLIYHLKKYNIKFSLDDHCTKVIETIEEKILLYEEIKKNALIAKSQFSSEDEEALKNFIKPNFKRELRSFQLHGLKHLINIHNGANFSVPGSGKTSVILAYYAYLKKKKNIDGLFIIGPTSSFEPWQTEFETCFDRKPNSMRLSGLSKDERNDIYLLINKYELFLVTYHTAARDTNSIIQAFKGKRFLVVLDESHYIKNPYGGILAESVLKISPYAKRKVVLTGTPMPNGLQDLWTQFTFLFNSQQPLGTAQEYLTLIQMGKAEKLTREIKKKIEPFFFRVTKKQLGLPKQNFKILETPMSKLQTRIYLGIANKFLTEIRESHGDKQTLKSYRKARSIRLMQVASNPSLLLKYSPEFQIPPVDFKGFSLVEGIKNYHKYEIPGKVLVALNLAKQIIEEDKKLIIWSSFVHNLDMIANLLKKYNPVVIHGGVPTESSDQEEQTRETLIEQFKNDPDCKVFIANPGACAESISLHKVCHEAIYLDRTFNCAHYLQSLDRIHRLGLNEDVKTNYYILLSKNSIDQVIHSRLKEKAKALKKIIEGTSIDEIKGYWNEDLGDEEYIDLDHVEKHILSLFKNAKN